MQAPSSYGNVYQMAFNEMYPNLAAEFKISYYPFLLEGVALNPELNQADGKHPNIKGVKIISQNLAKKINGEIIKIKDIISCNFKNAIIRKPNKSIQNKSIQNGLSSQNIHPEYETILEEHRNYVKAINEAGLKINLLEPLEEYPDSIFVEDPALTYKSTIIW